MIGLLKNFAKGVGICGLYLSFSVIGVLHKTFKKPMAEIRQ